MRKEVDYMQYELVQLEEKNVVGLRLKTRNSDPNMSTDIGALWQNFFMSGMPQKLVSRVNEKTIGLYTNYETDVNGAYDVLVCCEVAQVNSLPENAESEIIRAGKYAKFVVKGHMQQAVAEFWTALWAMNLDRRYSSDFEEYQPNSSMEQAEVHIYIALN